jgi:hypothetical protein
MTDSGGKNPPKQSGNRDMVFITGCQELKNLPITRAYKPIPEDFGGGDSY